MKVLIIGSGGREHTIAWKIAQSKLVDKIFAIPGNAGISKIAQCVPGSVTDISYIADFAENNLIDLTIVGPETPLIAGLVDELNKRGLTAFGPTKDAAQMEGSKVFAKELMFANNVPTAFYEEFNNSGKACDYIESIATKSDNPIVVKADGEAAGKGVFVCKSKADAINAVKEILDRKTFGASGDKLIIEEFLDGPETTFMCLVNGDKFTPMSPSQDYKRAYDNDEGLNTGGMGCYSPVPAFTDELKQITIDTIVKPTLNGLINKGIHYKGVLYCGLALTSKGPMVIEFNVRFGDPETQVVLPLLKSDFVNVLLDVCNNKLDETSISWYNMKAVCIVMASGGYPGDYTKGLAITGIDRAEKAGTTVFHAGTALKDGVLVTSGGRVLGVTAVGDSYKDCIDLAYKGVKEIHFDKVHFRNDIGARLL